MDTTEQMESILLISGIGELARAPSAPSKLSRQSFVFVFLNFARFIKSSPGLCNNYPGSQREVVPRLTDVCTCRLF